jgi:hypothetical protein
MRTHVCGAPHNARVPRRHVLQVAKESESLGQRHRHIHARFRERHRDGRVHPNTHSTAAAAAARSAREIACHTKAQRRRGAVRERLTQMGVRG